LLGRLMLGLEKVGRKQNMNVDIMDLIN